MDCLMDCLDHNQREETNGLFTGSNGLFTVSAVRAWRERVVAEINRLRIASTTMRSDYNLVPPNDHPPVDCKAGVHFPYGCEVLAGDSKGKVPPKYIPLKKEPANLPTLKKILAELNKGLPKGKIEMLEEGRDYEE